MKKVIIVIGGYKNNCGSEAMVRGTIKQLRQSGHACQIVVTSKDIQKNEKVRIPGADKMVAWFSYNRSNKLCRYFIGVLRYILKLKKITNWMNHYPIFKECKNADLVIVMGGDNYDKAYGAFADMHSINKTLRKIIENKLIFMNCSINPTEMNEQIINDLKQFDFITARENITYNALRKYFDVNKLSYIPDIAFCMNSSETILPSVFSEKVFGINLSPLILSDNYTDNPDEIMQAYIEIIRYIIEEMNFNVVLIPHVKNADAIVLKKIKEAYSVDNRVCLLGDAFYNAEEIKYIISKCELYIGARTHSTIAAYSSGVPTYVLGYSVKSRGISYDLFGREDYFVADIGKIKSKEEMINNFMHFIDSDRTFSLELKKIIPDYISKVDNYSILFHKLLEENNDDTATSR